ncbi:alpha-D-glucose phosphate-specific phosphoglucomutase [Brevundimonas staleyi]|uniref:phosphoglucomutase (alpha-D-glucose-1,6-bisphosphate-dependent) n=1 Tax=Brevundimonas staleyi TaxID=74326 RepID=A0ABW0FWL5_9CAUL
MSIETRAFTPFQDQKPGTSGLRKRTSEFRRPHYLESFVQAVFLADPPPPGATLVVGGDGRFFSPEAAEITARIALANGYARVVIGQDALFSTPAVSEAIRRLGAWGGVILSASHNAGGPDGDFGVKYNTRTGGPAPQAMGDRIHEITQSLDRYSLVEGLPLDLSRLGARALGSGGVEIVDPVGPYLDLLETLFDFDAIRGLFQGGFRFAFDAMNAVTGPYAVELFERRLGAPAGTVLRGEPLPDFGGEPPDPHLDHLHHLTTRMWSSHPLDLAAASDGDGDRNMILAPGRMVSPGDSLAVIAANADCLPAFADRLPITAARSMPTSRALDRVSQANGTPRVETPTGWKWFATLLEAGRIQLCGEESFGTGSDHVREKDGLWAVLCWLNILAARRQSAEALLKAHWETFGRDHYQRLDVDGLDPAQAEAMITALAATDAETLRARDPSVESVTVLDYVDPVSGDRMADAGVRISLSDDARITYRLSGTGSSGAALRVYIERYAPPGRALHADPVQLLAPLAATALTLVDLARFTGRTGPTSIS